MFGNSAYHAGDKNTNLRTLVFELTDDNPSCGYENYIKYIAWAMHQIGLTPTVETVLFHNEIVPTRYGKFLRDKGMAQIISGLKKYIAITNGDKPNDGSRPVPEKNSCRSSS